MIHPTSVTAVLDRALLNECCLHHAVACTHNIKSSIREESNELAHTEN